MSKVYTNSVLGGVNDLLSGMTDGTIGHVL